ncbi:MAG TPA: SDR family NAD(P)-dependent oxidoreductase [Fimbriimonadaceae bacterium]|jgi:NAD(P)-dependent dehydrogenase (short-subunit alcohol dehydrogenase family)
MANPFRHAIVIGGSSGIGEELVKQLAASGYKVAAVGRNEAKLREIATPYAGTVITFKHDVREYDKVPALFQEITKQLGGLDLFIYSSGVMPDVEMDEYDFDKDRAILETNLLGAVAWLDQAAIRFDKTGAGTIVGIGSVAGDRGRGGMPAYCTSKAALATYLESLRNRLSTKGVKVVTIKPGPTATPMTVNSKFKNMMPADKAAALILQKSKSGGEHYLALPHRVIFFVLRNVPSFIFRRMRI